VEIEIRKKFDLDNGFKHMFERFLKYLPFASGLLVFLGVLKVSIYYHYFGIPVLSYLSLSEVLMLFLNDLNSVLFVFIIGVIHAFASEELLNKYGNLLDVIVLRYRIGYVIFFGLTSGILLSIVLFDFLNIDLWNIYLLIFLVVQFWTYLFIKKALKIETGRFEIGFRLRKLLSLLIVLTVVGMMPLLAIRDIRKVERGEEEVTIYLDNGNDFTTSKTIIYLGKAGEYHFIFDSKMQKSTMIKNSSVKGIDRMDI
jgi:hypothetical protein